MTKRNGILVGALALLWATSLLFAQGVRPGENPRRDNALVARVTALERLLVHFTRIDHDILIDGANLHVRNGTGTTDGKPNFLGNLIIGYNEPRSEGNDRSGSHMLVVGKEHNYSSFGGIVVGQRHTTSGEYASVSGGRGNAASGDFASVSGGSFNTASTSRGKDNSQAKTSTLREMASGSTFRSHRPTAHSEAKTTAK